MRAQRSLASVPERRQWGYFKNSTLNMQCRTKTPRPIDPRTPTSSTPFEVVVQPVGGTRAQSSKRVRRKCTSETLRARTMNHRRSTTTSSRCPEWPRGSRDATPRRAHPPFSSTYISALCKPLTYARTPALWQHPRTTQWDRVTRRQEITFTEYGLSERSSLTRGTKYIYMSTAVPLDRAGTAGFRGWDLLLP